MKDFTKEELEEIVHMVNDINNGSQGHGLELNFDLRDKIQSMIDNYCEHEFIGDMPDGSYSCYGCEKEWGRNDNQ
jgi:hypothetical protein